MSSPVIFWQALTLLLIVVWRYTYLYGRMQPFSAFLMAAVICGIPGRWAFRHYYASARKNAKILLLWSFRHKVAHGLRNYLIANLAAYAEVILVEDKALDRVSEFASNGVEVGHATQYRYLDSEWKERVREHMRLADVLVFDLTIVSDGLAWELAEASRLRRATDIILVCQATAMASELTPLLARVQEAMIKLPGDHARWLDELLPPLVYATSLANVGFVVALNRRLKNFNRRH
jgi:hypothetical protein